MEIKSYFKQLLPDFDRYQVVETIEDSRKQIDETVLATLQRMDEAGVNGSGFKSKEARDAVNAFNAVFPRLRPRPFVPNMIAVFKTISENLEYMESQVSVLFSNKVTKESLTYRRTALLQLSDLANFAGEYAARQLNFVIEAETTGRIRERFIKPQLDYLRSNERIYLQALAALYVPKREFTAMLDSIPDIAVTPEQDDTVRATVGANKLDPFRMGFINQRINPIYRIRMMRAENQVKRHQAKKAEKQMLELRLLGMREQQQGQQDPRLQQQMDYMAGRIQSLQHDIVKFEEQYG